jgi:hypothetical protein
MAEASYSVASTNQYPLTPVDRGVRVYDADDNFIAHCSCATCKTVCSTSSYCTCVDFSYLWVFNEGVTDPPS